MIWDLDCLIKKNNTSGLLQFIVFETLVTIAIHLLGLVQTASNIKYLGLFKTLLRFKMLLMHLCGPTDLSNQVQ